MSTLNPEQFSTTSIKTRSIPNVESERLVARHHWLRTGYDPSAADARIELRHRAREKVLIERELQGRGITVPTERRPKPGADRR